MSSGMIVGAATCCCACDTPNIWQAFGNNRGAPSGAEVTISDVSECSRCYNDANPGAFQSTFLTSINANGIFTAHINETTSPGAGSETEFSCWGFHQYTLRNFINSSPYDSFINYPYPIEAEAREFLDCGGRTQNFHTYDHNVHLDIQELRNESNLNQPSLYHLNRVIVGVRFRYTHPDTGAEGTKIHATFSGVTPSQHFNLVDSIGPENGLDCINRSHQISTGGNAILSDLIF